MSHLTNFDIGFNEQWQLCETGSGSDGRIQNSVLASSMVSAATYYSMLYSATTHTAYLQSEMEEEPRSKPLQLQTKGLALSNLRQELTDLSSPITDELLLCMVTMAAHTNAEHMTRPEDWDSLQGPLAKAQEIAYYGSAPFESMHGMNSLLALEARGGLETITLPGLRETMIM